MEDYKTKKKILLEGITCNHCKYAIKSALSNLMGVSRVIVDLEGRYAILDTNIEITDSAITYAIRNLGYKVNKIQGL